MTDANKTDITLVLDQSPSMNPIWDATIQGVNLLLEDQKAQPGAADFTLHKFDTYVHEGYTGPLASVEPLNRTSYRPGGSGTALWDAIGHSIDATDKRLSLLPDYARASKVIFVIYTDGEENSSTRFNASRIKELIAARQKLGWDFIFLGAELNAYTIARNIGITSVMNTVRSAGATADAYLSTSTLMSAKRGAHDAFTAQTMNYASADIQKQRLYGAIAQPDPDDDKLVKSA